MKPKADKHGWLPIESAPTELRRSFLVYNALTGPYQTMRTANGFVCKIWGESGAAQIGTWFPEPTHWQPLPAPPESKHGND